MLGSHARLGDDIRMDLDELILAVSALWDVETSGWRVIVSGQTSTILLPAVDAVVHVSRPEVGTTHRGSARGPCQAGATRHPCGGSPAVSSRHQLGVDQRPGNRGRTLRRTRRENEHLGPAREGAGLLAQMHNAWSDLDLGPYGEACTWANWISPSAVVTVGRRVSRQLIEWGLDQLGADVVRLAEFTGEDPGLPLQVVHATSGTTTSTSVTSN